LNANGVASLTTTDLSVGSHVITAVYSGDANFSTSTGSLAQTVNPVATTTTLVSSLEPAVFGQPITIVASINPTVAGLGQPSGTVHFLFDGADLGTFPVDHGRAFLNLPSLT